jgi:acid phosphatase (class A)
MNRSYVRSWIFVASTCGLLLLAACATTTAPAARPATAVAANGVERWFEPDSLRLLALLPPVPDAASTRAELDDILQRQSRRTATDCAAADLDANKDLSRFAGALGLGVAVEDPRLRETARLLSDLRRLQEAITSRVKDETRRPRPFRQDERITTCIDRPLSDSYPSGHATFGMATALLLADMVPERRAELLIRGIEYGEQRVIGGVHFASDVAAGRTAGTIIAAFLLASPQYQREAATAKTSLRAALGLTSLQ